MTNYNVTGGLNDNTVYHVSVTASNNAGSSSSATTSIRTNSNGKLCINNCVYPYEGKLWRVETLADLANEHKFAKVSLAKILCLIHFAKLVFVVNLPKFAPTKGSG